MTVNKTEALNIISVVYGLQGEAAEQKLQSLSDTELTQLISNHKKDMDKGVALEKNKSEQPSIVMLGDNRTYTDDFGNEITDFYDGENILQRVIKDKDGNSTTVTYKDNKPFTQTKNINGNVEKSKFTYYDGEEPFVTVDTTKADGTKVTTNTQYVTQNGDVVNDYIKDKTTVKPDGTKITITPKNINLKSPLNEKKTFFKGEVMEEVVETFKGKKKTTYFEGTDFENRGRRILAQTSDNTVYYNSDDKPVYNHKEYVKKQQEEAYKAEYEKRMERAIPLKGTHTNVLSNSVTLGKAENVTVKEFITNILGIDINSETGKKLADRFVRLPDDALGKISYTDYEAQTLGTGKFAPKTNDYSKESFEKIARDLRQKSGVNIETQDEITQHRIQMTIQDNALQNRKTELGIDANNFAKESLAAVYEQAAGMLMQDRNRTMNPLDPKDYAHFAKNVGTAFLDNASMGLLAKDAFHQASDYEDFAQKLRNLPANSPEEFAREYEKLTGQKYDVAKVKGFMEFLNKSNLDKMDDIKRAEFLKSDKYKSEFAKAFGFRTTENTEKQLSNENMAEEFAGVVGDVYMLVQTGGLSSMRTLVSGSGKLTGKMLSKTPLSKKAVGIISETTARATGGAVSMAGLTAMKSVSGNIVYDEIDATDFDTWKNTAIGIGESGVLGAVGGVVGKMAEPVVKYIEKPAEREAQAMLEAFSNRGEMSAKELMQTVSKESGISLDGLFKMNKQELVNLLRTTAGKGFEITAEAGAFGVTEAVMDSSDKSFSERLEEQYEMLTKMKGASKLVQMVAAGKAGKAALINSSKVLNETRVKPTKTPEGKTQFELTLPNGRKIITENPEHALATCNYLMQAELVAKAVKNDKENDGISTDGEDVHGMQDNLEYFEKKRSERKQLEESPVEDYVTKTNKGLFDFMNKNGFSDDEIKNILSVTTKKNINLAENLCKNQNIPKKQITNILNITRNKIAKMLNDEVPKNRIDRFNEQLNQFGQELADDKDIQKPRITQILESLNEANISFARQLYSENKVNKNLLATYVRHINTENLPLAQKMYKDGTDVFKVAKILMFTNKNNLAIAEKLYNAGEFDIMDNILELTSSGKTPQDKITQDVINQIKELDNILPQDCKLYKNGFTDLIVNAPEKYQRIVNSGILGMIKDNSLSSDILKRLNRNTDLSDDIYSDLELVRNGKSIVSEFPENTDLQEAFSQTKVGDAVEVGNKMYINDGENLVEWKMTKDKFSELFPPVKRFSTVQNGTGDCYLVSPLSHIMSNPNTRAEFYKSFEYDGKDVKVTIKAYEDYQGSYKFIGGKFDDKFNDRHLIGCEGMKMYERAYAKVALRTQGEPYAATMGINDLMDRINGGRQDRVISEVLGYGHGSQFVNNFATAADFDHAIFEKIPYTDSVTKETVMKTPKADELNEILDNYDENYPNTPISLQDLDIKSVEVLLNRTANSHDYLLEFAAYTSLPEFNIQGKHAHSVVAYDAKTKIVKISQPTNYTLTTDVPLEKFYNVLKNTTYTKVKKATTQNNTEKSATQFDILSSEVDNISSFDEISKMRRKLSQTKLEDKSEQKVLFKKLKDKEQDLKENEALLKLGVKAGDSVDKFNTIKEFTRNSNSISAIIAEKMNNTTIYHDIKVEIDDFGNVVSKTKTKLRDYKPKTESKPVGKLFDYSYGYSEDRIAYDGGMSESAFDAFRMRMYPDLFDAYVVKGGVVKGNTNSMYESLKHLDTNNSRKPINLAPLGENSIRGRNLLTLSSKLLDEAKSKGIERLIDLRAEAGDKERIQEINGKKYVEGIEYINVPMDYSVGRCDPELIQNMSDFFDAMDKGKVYIGCNLGSHRTDFAIAVNYALNTNTKEASPMLYLNMTDIVKGVRRVYKKIMDMAPEERKANNVSDELLNILPKNQEELDKRLKRIAQVTDEAK